MSKIEVDTIEPQSGTSLTLGASGDTITIPSGATLSSTDPLVFPAGTVSAPAVTTSGDTNTGIFFPSADTIAFTEGGTEAMRIDSSGNVGIGLTNPTYKLDIFGNQPSIQVKDDGATNQCAVLATAGDTSASLTVSRSGGNASLLKIQAQGNNPFIELQSLAGNSNYIQNFNQDLLFKTNGDNERMRIDSSGNLNIGTTSTLGKTTIIWDNSAQQGITLKPTTVTYNASPIQFLHSTGTQSGAITQTSTSVSYTTGSDYRLKENVTYNFDATTRLKQLKPARFNFIENPNKTVDGFLAHEVQDIIPEAISGTKDETKTKEKVVVNADGNVIAENIEQADWEAGKILDEEGTSQYPIDSTWEASKIVPVYQGIDQSKLTPILTKALQEAIARIEQLEARLTALESN